MSSTNVPASLDQSDISYADDNGKIIQSRCRSLYMGEDPSRKCNVHEWFVQETVKVLDVDMKVNAPSVFHRKIYTIDPEDNVYMKFAEISDAIKSLDELILMDTRSCILRLECKCYIVVRQGEKEELTCTVGALSNRYIDNASLDGYPLRCSKASRSEFAPLAETLKRLNTIENHIEYASGRLHSDWERYQDNIARNFARHV